MNHNFRPFFSFNQTYVCCKVHFCCLFFPQKLSFSKTSFRKYTISVLNSLNPEWHTIISGFKLLAKVNISRKHWQAKGWIISTITVNDKGFFSLLMGLSIHLQNLRKGVKELSLMWQNLPNTVDPGSTIFVVSSYGMFGRARVNKLIWIMQIARMALLMLGWGSGWNFKVTIIPLWPLGIDLLSILTFYTSPTFPKICLPYST